MSEYKELNPQDEDELIHACKRGDQTALTTLIDRYSELVHSYVMAITGDREVVEDLAQEAFLKMLSALPNYEFRAPFRAWFMRIVVNLCRDHLRRRKVRKIITFFRDDQNQFNGPAFIDSSPNPWQELIKKERLELLRQAIVKLPPALREVVILRDVEELSYEEIAEVLDWKMGTIKSRLFRARNRLAELLTPAWEEIK